METRTEGNTSDMAVKPEGQIHHGAWVLGHEEEDGGFVLEPWFVSTTDWVTWCARRMLEDHGVCGSVALTMLMGEDLPDVLAQRDVVITCPACAALLVAEGQARPVTPHVGQAASKHFWEVQRYRQRRGLPEQAVRS